VLRFGEQNLSDALTCSVD